MIADLLVGYYAHVVADLSSRLLKK